jgi:Lar family restriction alleviation protein
MEDKMLKPCPFCGEKEDIVIREKQWKSHTYYFVECLPCDAKTKEGYDYDYHIYGKSGKEMAVDYWNTRTDDRKST